MKTRPLCGANIGGNARRSEDEKLTKEKTGSNVRVGKDNGNYYFITAALSSFVRIPSEISVIEITEINKLKTCFWME